MLYEVITAECNQIIDIAHSSILKFTDEFDMSELQKIIKNQKIDYSLFINHLDIATQNIYPFADCQIIKRFKLYVITSYSIHYTKLYEFLTISALVSALVSSKTARRETTILPLALSILRIWKG